MHEGCEYRMRRETTITPRQRLLWIRKLMLLIFSFSTPASLSRSAACHLVTIQLLQALRCSVISRAELGLHYLFSHSLVSPSPNQIFIPFPIHLRIKTPLYGQIQLCILISSNIHNQNFIHHFVIQLHQQQLPILLCRYVIT